MLLSPAGFKTIVFRRRMLNGSGAVNDFNTLTPQENFVVFLFFLQPASAGD